MSQSLKWFNDSLQRNCGQFLYVAENLGNIFSKLQDQKSTTQFNVTNSIESLKDPTKWRPLMLPLSIMQISIVETFLEKLFIEIINDRYRTQFKTKDELCKNPGTMKLLRLSVQNFNPSKLKRMSFQRLGDVNGLYSTFFDFDISSFTDWIALQILFEKRHLFAHRSGMIDERFLRKYNSLQAKIGGTDIGPEKIGDLAFVEISWVRSAEEVIINFTKYVDQGVSITAQ